uniref:WRC domain-containing protein n=1 Tax=Araucaria cunninghamii TaxID=56994 RepID=A0A0D6R268_ARACU
MRIRKRSVAVLSRHSWEKAGAAACIGDGDNDENAKEEFLRPLVAAVMDVQSKDESEIAGDFRRKPSPVLEIPEMGVRRRPTHNWRNALLGFDLDSGAVEVGGEGINPNHRWNALVSRIGEDNFQSLTNEVTVNGGRLSSVKQEMSGVHRKRELPKLAPSEKCLMAIESDKEQDLGVDASKKKRSIMDRATECNVIGHINARRKDGSEINNGTIMENGKPKKKSKAQDNDKRNTNYHGGSQCRRRNGRGWRCSQRTLVGYSLCEHHLGKGRLKSINTSDGSIAENKNGGKFKELHLIHATTCHIDF